MTLRVGDLIIGADIFDTPCDPDIWRILSIKEPAENVSPSNQVITVRRRSDNKVVTGIRGNEVMKYETYMIFRIMAMLSRVGTLNLAREIQLP